MCVLLWESVTRGVWGLSGAILDDTGDPGNKLDVLPFKLDPLRLRFTDLPG